LEVVRLLCKELLLVHVLQLRKVVLDQLLLKDDHLLFFAIELD